MRLLVKDIKTLAGIDRHDKLRLQGSEMQTLEQINDAYLTAEDGRITGFGTMDSLTDAAAVAVMVRPAYPYSVCRQP